MESLELLTALIKASKQNGGETVGDFKLREFSAEDIYSFFDLSNSSEANLAKTKDFHFFGSSRDRAAFAIWKNAPIGEPIVYFGPKGLLKVVAPSLSIFLGLLVDNRHDPIADHHDHGHNEDHNHKHESFSGDWLREFLEQQKIMYPIIYRPSFNDLKNERAFLKLVSL